MPTRLEGMVVDAVDPAGLARFWASALDWEITAEEPDEVVVELPEAVLWGEGGPAALVFVPVVEPKTVKNRVHLDLASASTDEQGATVARLLDLGARHADVGQGEVPWEVMADPEGNELCVLDPRDAYRDTGPLAAVVLDCADPVALAPFWAEATGWPVIHQSEHLAALRHPTAPGTRLELLAAPGRKVTKNRLHPDVRPYPPDDLAIEVARLERAGARRIDIGQGEVSWVVMADPEGNELCVLSPG